MNVHKRPFLIFIMIVIVVIFGAFIMVRYPAQARIKTAKAVLFNLLNAPNGELEAAYDRLFSDMDAASSSESSLETIDGDGTPGIKGVESTQVEHAVSELLENKASDRFLESCIRINEIMSLQHYAMMDGFKSELQELSVARTRQKGTLEYDAVLPPVSTPAAVFDFF